MKLALLNLKSGRIYGHIWTPCWGRIILPLNFDQGQKGESKNIKKERIHIKIKLINERIRNLDFKIQHPTIEERIIQSWKLGLDF